MQVPRGTTQRLPSRIGAGRQGNIFSFQSREKNALDIPSYRSGVITSLRSFFASLKASCRACHERGQQGGATLDGFISYPVKRGEGREN